MDIDPSSSFSQSLADSEESFPIHPFIVKLRHSHEVVKTGTEIDFPIFLDYDVRHAMGQRGRPFGSQIKRELYWHTVEQKLVGALWFSYSCEGPPGSVHGGAIATALDSCIGYCVLRGVGLGFVTLNLNVNYRKFIKLGSVVRVECKIVKREGRKVYLYGKLTDGDDNIYAEAEALFYRSHEHSLDFVEAQKTLGPKSGITPGKLLKEIDAFKKQARAMEKEEKSNKAKL